MDLKIFPGEKPPDPRYKGAASNAAGEGVSNAGTEGEEEGEGRLRGRWGSGGGREGKGEREGEGEGGEGGGRGEGTWPNSPLHQKFLDSPLYIGWYEH